MSASAQLLTMNAEHRTMIDTPPPHVAVMILCHNHEHHLRYCVASAPPHEGVEVGVLMVDDASTDSSTDVAPSIANEKSRVTVIAHRQNVDGLFRRGRRALGTSGGSLRTRISRDRSGDPARRPPRGGDGDNRSRQACPGREAFTLRTSEP